MIDGGYLYSHKITIPYIVVDANYTKILTTLINLQTENCDIWRILPVVPTGDNTNITAFGDVQIVPIYWMYLVFKSAYLLQIYIVRYLINMKCRGSCANSYYLPTALS